MSVDGLGGDFGGVFDVKKVQGIGEFRVEDLKEGEKVVGKKYMVGKAFLVVREKTIEVRTDGRLAKNLREKYETVMDSRYFGRGGIEIVMSGQLGEEEVEDLVRLSYNLTKEGE